MTRVLLLGYYGFGNFGDDLFNDALVSLLGEQDRRAAVTIPSSSSARARAFSAVPDRAARFWRSSGKPAGLFRNLVTHALVLRSDVIVFGGGSLFQSGARLRRRERLIDLARRFGKRVVAIGVSVGPAEPGQENRVAEVVRKLDGIGVRDRSSMEFCEAYGIERASFTGDLALGHVRPRAAAAQNRLGVALHGKRYQGALREKVRRLAREADEVLLLTLDPLHPGWIEAVRRDLMAEAPDVRVVETCYEGDTEATLEHIAHCRILVTSKLHGGITARALGVPFLLDEYHAKCTEFLRDIGWRVEVNGPEDAGEIEARWRSEIEPADFERMRALQLGFPILEKAA